MTIVYQVFGVAAWGIVRNTIELLVGNNMVPLRSDTIRLDPSPRRRILLPDSLLNSFHQEGLRTIDQSTGGKLRDHNAKESWALLEDLALYDNESWNGPRDFTKPVKEIALPQDVLMNKITTSCEICNGPHDTQYCMENPKQAFVDYASSRTDEAGDFKQQQSEMTNKIDTVLKAITDRIAGLLPSDTVKNPKLGATLVLSACSYPTEDPQCSTHIHSSINTITIHLKEPEESQVNEPNIGQK
nr:hypothetical protein [Tanacetum cinerariifolium]